MDRKSLLLYAVTDRAWLNGRALIEQVEDALNGGATFVQLREKTLDRETFLQEAKEIGVLCRARGVPFVVNDEVEIALASGADGVHVGQDDMEAGNVRSRIGPEKILGVSAHSVEEALRAERAGADYLGVGAAFPTGTKKDAGAISKETIREICAAVSIPVIAIGGIGRSNILQLSGCGLSGAAVVSAIFAQENVEQASRELRSLAEQMTTRE